MKRISKTRNENTRCRRLDAGELATAKGGSVDITTPVPPPTGPK